MPLKIDRTAMSIDPLTSSLCYVTPDLPGIGGRLKQRPTDFIVDEVPLYEPQGTGEHLYLFIEKEHQTTTDVVRRLAKMFGVKRGDIGYAGLKDKHAITRQHFSVWLPDASNDEKFLSRFEFLPFRLLWSRRHTNKLRRGHLKGNRFIIHVRDVDPAQVVMVDRCLGLIADGGVPNYLGHQRFGYRQNNHLLGQSLIRGQWQVMLDQMLGNAGSDTGLATARGGEAYETGDYAAALDVWPRRMRHDRQALDALRQGKSARDAVMSIDAGQREFLVNAAQSDVFNQIVDRRIRREGWPAVQRLREGDLAWKHDNRSVFAVDEATAEVENGPGGRVTTFDVSPSGPMWGAGMARAAGAVDVAEVEALAAAGLSQADLDAVDYVPVYGTRRPMRVPLTDPDVSSGSDEHGPYIRLVFALPRGSYATVVMREIMKIEHRDAARKIRTEAQIAGDAEEKSRG